MQDFGAEGGHFRRFFETDFIDALGRRHHARIGGVNARHVGPDIHPANAERLAEQRGGIVAAAAAERGSTAFRLAADKIQVTTSASCRRGCNCAQASSLSAALSGTARPK